MQFGLDKSLPSPPTPPSFPHKQVFCRFISTFVREHNLCYWCFLDRSMEQCWIIKYKRKSGKISNYNRKNIELQKYTLLKKIISKELSMMVVDLFLLGLVSCYNDLVNILITEVDWLWSKLVVASQSFRWDDGFLNFDLIFLMHPFGWELRTLWGSDNMYTFWYIWLCRCSSCGNVL